MARLFTQKGLLLAIYLLSFIQVQAHDMAFVPSLNNEPEKPKELPKPLRNGLPMPAPNLPFWFERCLYYNYYPLKQAEEQLPDPITFTINKSKDSVKIGEEFEIQIRAQLNGLSANLAYYTEELKAFHLVMLLPDGFVQTGGDFYDGIGTRLNENQSEITYTIKGYFQKETNTNQFRLLRGFSNNGWQANALFEVKAAFNVGIITPKTQQIAKKIEAKTLTGTKASPMMTLTNCTTFNAEVSVTDVCAGNNIRLVVN